MSVAELRDNFLDAFFSFELAIARWLSWLGEGDEKTPFGQRLQNFADHPKLRSKAGPKQTKAIQALPSASGDLLKLRNLVAHSRLQLGQIGGQDRIFETVALALAGENAVIPIEPSALLHSAQELKSQASKLEGWLKQARKD